MGILPLKLAMNWFPQRMQRPKLVSFAENAHFFDGLTFFAPLDRNTLAMDRDTLAMDRDTLAMDRDTLAMDRNTLALDHDTLAMDRNTLAMDRDTASIMGSRSSIMCTTLVPIWVGGRTPPLPPKPDRRVSRVRLSSSWS